MESSIRLLERDNSIDILRFVGLSLIILAHVSVPDILFNVRCFDVPLMLFVSGLTYAKRKVKMSWSFIWHRLTRLVIPVYVFLIAYFTLAFLLKKLAGIDFVIQVKHILGSFFVHIPLVQLTGIIEISWPIRYLIVYGGAAAFVWVQVHMVNKLQNQSNLNSLKFLKG